METTSREFKKSLSDMSTILKTIVAFANTKGGSIFVGIRDDRREVGMDIGKNTIENLANNIINFTLSPIYPEIKILKKENKKVLKIKIRESKTKPHFYKGIAYKRVSKTNQRLSPQELEKLFIKKKRSILTFDALTAEAEIKDISKDKLIKFIKECVEKRNMQIRYTNIKDSLKRVGVLRNQRLLNAGVMAFGEDPYQLYPNLAFRCTYRKSTEIEDYLFITGSLFKIIEKTIEFVKKHLNKKAKIEKLKRIESYEIPIEAIRELITNSIIHRDYFCNSGNYLEISDEKIIIKNPGEMIPPLTIKKLYLSHESIPRNPIIASLAYLSGIIEQWGSGTNKVIRLCLESELKIARFEQKDGFFYSTVYRKAIKSKDAENLIIEILSKGEHNLKEISEKTKISYRVVRYTIEKLKEKGIILEKGETRNKKFYIL